MEDNTIYNRVISDLEFRRNRVLSGKVNCIPWGLSRFEENSGIPGIEQGKYYLITANAKVGKSQIADHLFIFNALEQAKKANITLKIFYFSLEMAAEVKMAQAMSNYLYTKYNIRIAPVDLRSTRKQNVLSQEVLDILKKEEEYFKELTKAVTYIDDIRHPTGIFKFMEKYALDNGIQHKKKVEWKNSRTGEVTSTVVDDYYEANNPDEYVIVIIDHISLISTEKEEGRDLSLHQSITKLSSRYLVSLRNKFNYIPVVIQQQALAQESNENLKYGKLKPTADGLGDNKLTSRDVDVMFGLFSPYRHKMRMYPEQDGYDIGKFKDRIRFLEVIVSRSGGGGTIIPLYFDGAVNYFEELPRLSDTRLENFYKLAIS